MKTSIKFIVAMTVFVALGYLSSQAQIPGKTYQVGDTMIVDGKCCVVFQADETGLHGKVISSRYLLSYKTETKLEKIQSKISKEYKKKIKKGVATQEDLDRELLYAKSMEDFPNITSKLVRSYSKLAEYESKLPEGWRFPNYEDCNDISLNQLGVPVNEAKKGFKNIFLENNPKEITYEPMMWLMSGVMSYGLIANINNDVQYFRLMTVTGSLGYKLWDRFTGNEFGAFVKDF